MSDYLKFYINGEWIAPETPKTLDVINPSDESTVARISVGSAADVNKAVAAARTAFEAFSKTTVQERVELLETIFNAYKKRYDDIANAMSSEMGAPIWLSKTAQAGMGIAHLKEAIKILKNFEFVQQQGSTSLLYEPIGVVGMITPWNWPINQIMCKVAPALATGCTMILKPSEIAPLNALIFAELLHEAGVPAGVFNLVNGDGTGVGAAMSAHPDIDMISFTGSTRAGIAVAQAAAPTIKRVSQELGGKSAFIVLDDADLEKAVRRCINGCFLNSGQSCNAPTRLLVPASMAQQAAEFAKDAAGRFEVDLANVEGKKQLGPVVSEAQFNKIQGLIQVAIDEGATLVAGGTGRAEGFDNGYFVKPTVFADVTPEMTIAKEEVFGPVLSIISYTSQEEAIRIANDSIYGLSGYIESGNIENARALAAQLRTGMVHLNGAGPDLSAPFGGYKQSGNGKEWGIYGFNEFLEVKAVMGYNE